MTILAGIYSRRENQSPPPAVGEALRRLISRSANEEVSVFTDDRTYFVHVDVGAFGEPGHSTGVDNSVSLLAGEPLLAQSDPRGWQSRERDLALLADSLTRDDWGMLSRAQGTFCAVNYQPATGVLNLVSDKLGVCPLYFWADERYVIFASALRVLEGLAEIPKRMSVRAVTEMVGFGYPLGDRTPYADIFVLRAGEVVRFAGPEMSRHRYWRWEEAAAATGTKSEDELLKELYARFENGVARRARHDTTTVAYLSGGLDSRCVVGALVHLGLRVHTFNFARPWTQDQLFGRDFARAVDAMHLEVPKMPGDLVPDYSTLMAREWKAAPRRTSDPAERPAVVWSGEGGSVALGHVHTSRKIVELMRAGRVDAAISEYVENEYIFVPPKLFRAGVFAELAGIINEGIREELESLPTPHDPARSFYLYFMLNDQRRKLYNHFENIDLHRLEFQLPFFDGAFLELIASAPLDLCLEHKLYVKWLRLFPAAVTTVPWQAYPGHEPCPLPLPSGLSYQWDARYLNAERRTQKNAVVRQAAELLKAADFPDRLLDRRHFRLVRWIHATGWRDYEYLIKAAQTYHTYWSKCQGACAMPSVTA